MEKNREKAWEQSYVTTGNGGLCCVCLPQPLFADRWVGILTFWQVIETIDLAYVGDHAYYEVTMPLPPYPRITCLLQDVTALATGTTINFLCVLLFAVVFLSALYWASYRMNEL